MWVNKDMQLYKNKSSDFLSEHRLIHHLPESFVVKDLVAVCGGGAGAGGGRLLSGPV